MSTGTSISGPTVAASASELRRPKVPMATAIASSKLRMHGLGVEDRERGQSGVKRV
jgi:hypothetical protein